MDVKTMEQVRTALLEKWQQLREGAGRLGKDDADESVVPLSEMVDIAQSLEQLDRETSLAEQGRRELLAIERALAKMATPQFGMCEDCGEEIPVKRLVVVPEARLCANCQAFEERRSARSARPKTPGLVAR